MGAGIKQNTIGAIVVGGSAGCIEVLQTILTAQPCHATALVIVVHLPPRGPSLLHETLMFKSAWPIKQAEDKEPMLGGVAYCAPPGYHLLIESDRSFALSMDDPVHFSRPSIDVLFESACDAFERSLMGILVSGANEDGAKGLHSIHSAGGITVVQSPSSAEVATMPASALALFQPTHTLPPMEIAALITSMSQGESASA